MDRKQIAWYLIIGGGAIILLTFITTIFSFIGNHPWLSLAFISLGIGAFLLNFEK